MLVEDKLGMDLPENRLYLIYLPDIGFIFKDKAADPYKHLGNGFHHAAILSPTARSKEGCLVLMGNFTNKSEDKHYKFTFME